MATAISSKACNTVWRIFHVALFHRQYAAIVTRAARNTGSEDPVKNGFHGHVHAFLVYTWQFFLTESANTDSGPTLKSSLGGPSSAIVLSPRSRDCEY
jgi:hypothetical protein